MKRDSGEIIKKVFISAEIEGVTSTTLRDETHPDQAIYAPHAKQMPKEVTLIRGWDGHPYGMVRGCNGKEVRDVFCWRNYPGAEAAAV